MYITMGKIEAWKMILKNYELKQMKIAYVLSRLLSFNSGNFEKDTGKEIFAIKNLNITFVLKPF